MRNPFSKKKAQPLTPAMATTHGPAQTDSSNDFLSAPSKVTFTKPPTVLIIGAGSRGTWYAKSIVASTNSTVLAVCEPLPYKRANFGRRFIWGAGTPRPEQQFDDWRQWVAYEEGRRQKEAAGEQVERGIDAVFVCVLDEMHEEVVCGIAHLGVHVCCEKPLSTSLESCMRIWQALKEGGTQKKEIVFGIGHVLRYSPHNMLLRQLVLEKEVVGDVISIEHVEPVGYWHFSHSYVRGNWRKESTTAPSLLTKSCHDIDFLLWMLCSPAPNKTEPHFPSFLTSTGSLKFFRKDRKPAEAGKATNCLSCPIEKDCNYSAKRIYIDKQLAHGNTDWPVKIVNPEMEELYKTSGKEAAVAQLLRDLGEDYTAEAPVHEVEVRPWYGRCVYEADNDVCDDQCVTITWDDDPISVDGASAPSLHGRGAKTAQFHMVAFTEQICKRRGRIYGTKGEIEYDSSTIKVHDFSTGHTKVHKPHMAASGHGGGDEGLARQFIMAVEAADSKRMPAAEAQREFLGCDLDEVFMSHAMVFAAEEARKEKKVVDWKMWWEEKVESQLG